jgi:hypothetical protein
MQTRSADPPSVHGRLPRDAGIRVGKSTLSILRQIKSGVLMSDGSRRYLPATFDGGAYRIKDEDIDTFYADLTADRLARYRREPRT